MANTPITLAGVPQDATVITPTGTGTDDTITFTEGIANKTDRLVQIVGSAAWGYSFSPAIATANKVPVAAGQTFTYSPRDQSVFHFEPTTATAGKIWVTAIN